jgi:hypothetical protein
MSMRREFVFQLDSAIWMGHELNADRWAKEISPGRGGLWEMSRSKRLAQTPSLQGPLSPGCLKQNIQFLKRHLVCGTFIAEKYGVLRRTDLAGVQLSFT